MEKAWSEKRQMNSTLSLGKHKDYQLVQISVVKLVFGEKSIALSICSIFPRRIALIHSEAHTLGGPKCCKVSKTLICLKI